MKLLDKLILEIGYNHLGSRYLLREYLNQAGALSEYLTLQYRTDSFNEEWQISPEVLMQEVKQFKQRTGCRVGLAVDSKEGYIVAQRSFDFCKVLYVAANAEWLGDIDAENDFKVFVSLGTTSFSAIDSRHVLRTRRENVFPVYTSFDRSGKDISYKEIDLIKRECSEYGIGSHQDNWRQFLLLSQRYKGAWLMAYFSLQGMKHISPDGKHSMDASEVEELKSLHSFSEGAEKNDPRVDFKQFDEVKP